MDVCIHGMCKTKRESNEKMEKIRVLAISPIWAPLSSSPKFRKEKELLHISTHEVCDLLT